MQSVLAVLCLVAVASAQTWREQAAAFRPPVVCPNAPVRPDSSKYCNWIPIMDKSNCIRKYECEPVNTPKCELEPMRPEESSNCDWIPLKDAQGCILSYECVLSEPAEMVGLPLSLDASHACCGLAARGECETNPEQMKVHCAGSCSQYGCSNIYNQNACISELMNAGCFGYGRYNNFYNFWN